ncbi:hypothetical protein V2J09_005879 [Rumex salicifolius]
MKFSMSIKRSSSLKSAALRFASASLADAAGASVLRCLSNRILPVKEEVEVAAPLLDLRGTKA